MPELIPAEPRSPGWHAARRAGVTATDIVTILGLSRYDSVYSLFWRKMQQAPEVPDNDRFRLGRYLEGYIASRWLDDHMAPEHRPWQLEAGGLYRHSECAWQMATPDRLHRGAPLELKSWADADKSSWQDGPPAQVRAQVLWQMDVMDVATGHVGVVFLPSGEFRSYTIEHVHKINGPLWNGHNHCDVCDDQELMQDAGEEFMARLRLELPPPDPDASAATLAAVRARFTRQPDKQAEVDGQVFQQWADFKAAAKINDDNARGFEIKLREQAGEASVLTVDGQPVARRIIVDADVKAHHRHQDYLKRIEPKGDDSDEYTLEAIGLTLTAGMDYLNVKLALTGNAGYERLPSQILMAPSEARELAAALEKFAAIGIEGGNDD
jgi:putative phage-type endonuclease